MRITDHQKLKVQRRRLRWCIRAVQTFVLDLPLQVVAMCVEAAREENKNLQLLARRTRQIQATDFNLNAFSDKECLAKYRFTRHDIGRITNLINYNGQTERRKYISDPVACTYILLHRMATPIRWTDVERIYGMHDSKLSELFWEVGEQFVDMFGYTLELRGNFLAERSNVYAEAIREFGAPLPNVVGVIDCTKIRMCRPGGPSINQRSVYNGHKKMHCIIYQTISTPDGLIFALYGPVVGRRHDINLYHQSCWEQILEASILIDGIKFYIFGDSAYILLPWLLRPFVMPDNGSIEAQLNTEMAKIRIMVEQNYLDIKQFWTHNDFSRNMKVRKGPIAIIYKESAILTNFHVCLYKTGITHHRFRVDFPTLEEYLEAQ